jgi:hypothetical protein
LCCFSITIFLPCKLKNAFPFCCCHTRCCQDYKTFDSFHGKARKIPLFTVVDPKTFRTAVNSSNRGEGGGGLPGYSRPNPPKPKLKKKRVL